MEPFHRACGFFILTAALAAGSLAHAGASAANAFPVPGRGELDCNGFSLMQLPLDPTLPCADPRGRDGRGEDNGHYIGHDEPSTGFYSTASRSGFDMQWEIKLPVDGPLPATQTYENQIAFYVRSDIIWVSPGICNG